MLLGSANGNGATTTTTTNSSSSSSNTSINGKEHGKSKCHEYRSTQNCRMERSVCVCAVRARTHEHTPHSILYAQVKLEFQFDSLNLLLPLTFAICSRWRCITFNSIISKFVIFTFKYGCKSPSVSAATAFCPNPAELPHSVYHYWQRWWCGILFIADTTIALLCSVVRVMNLK